MSKLLRTWPALLALLALPAPAQEKNPASRTPAWLDARILEIQPTPVERKFDTIAWVPTVGKALQLAREHGRPIMLFTYDGAMEVGRC